VVVTFLVGVFLQFTIFVWVRVSSNLTIHFRFCLACHCCSFLNSILVYISVSSLHSKQSVTPSLSVCVCVCLSVSTTDLCVGWDSGFSYLRRSPDQFSSRGSLDSLDPPPPSQSRAEPSNAPLDHGDHYPTPTHSSTRSQPYTTVLFIH